MNWNGFNDENFLKKLGRRPLNCIPDDALKRGIRLYTAKVSESDSKMRDALDMGDAELFRHLKVVKGVDRKSVGWLSDELVRRGKLLFGEKQNED